MAAELMQPILTGWRGAVLVCGKCSRKLDGGFGDGGKKPLAKHLRKSLGLLKGKKGRAATGGVLETKCLGICPKRGVMVVDTARPDRWLVVPAGTAVEEVAAALPSLIFTGQEEPAVPK